MKNLIFILKSVIIFMHQLRFYMFFIQLNLYLITIQNGVCWYWKGCQTVSKLHDADTQPSGLTFTFSQHSVSLQVIINLYIIEIRDFCQNLCSSNIKHMNKKYCVIARAQTQYLYLGWRAFYSLWLLWCGQDHNASHTCHCRYLSHHSYSVQSMLRNLWEITLFC